MARETRGMFDDPYARAASIPLVLWVSAAIVFHMAGGEGAMKAAELVHERDELRALVQTARQSMHPPDTTFEVLLDDTVPSPAPQVAAPEGTPATDTSGTPPDPDAPKADEPPKPAKPEPPKRLKAELPKVEPPKVESPKVEPKPPPPKPLVPLMPSPAVAAPPPPPPPPPPMPEADHRLAVRQHVEKDQKDNETATRIADEANTTDRETIARARSHDQDLANPTMGSKAGPKGEIGSGDKEDRVADSESHKGDAKHAPGENAKPTSTSAEHESPATKAPVLPGPSGPPPSIPGASGAGAKGAQGGGDTSPPSPGGAGPASPEVAAGARGSYSLDPANPGGDGKSRSPGKKKFMQFQMPVHVSSVGLNGKGVPGGPQINLNMAGVEAAVGKEQLKAERAADGAARLSAHRGAYEKNKFDKWRPAIENYEPTVTLGDATSLNAARVPFATYLNSIHNRIHPIFAEEYLSALDRLARSNKLNVDAQHLVTHLEIVLARDTGRILRMGVVKTSGATEFDVAALDAVNRAQPFGKAPEIIASWDGHVYLHWEFHRDPQDACSTRNARPFLVATEPKHSAKPTPLKRPPAAARDERGAPVAPLIPTQ